MMFFVKSWPVTSSKLEGLATLEVSLVNAKNEIIRTGRSEAVQALVFLAVAIFVGLPSLLVGGFVVGYVAFFVFGLLFVIFFAGERRDFALSFYIFLAVGFLVGGLVYDGLDSAGAVIRVSNWPLIGPLFEPSAVQTGLAILAGLSSGVVAIIVLMVVMRTGGETIIVDEGKTVKTEPGSLLGKFFGAPSTLVIRPYNAVVLMRGSKVSRIEGPGSTKLKKDEEVRDFVDLRPQSGGYEEKVRTKDNFPLTVRGGVGFRIESRDEALERKDEGDSETRDVSGVIGGCYPVFRHTLHRAVYAVGAGKDWIEKAKGAPGGKLRDAIRNYYLEDIFPLNGAERDESILSELAGQVTEGVKKSAQGWGVTVYGVGVNEIEMPEHVRQHWEAAWQKRLDTIAAESKRAAEVIEAWGKNEATKVVAEGQGEAVRLLEGVKDVVLRRFGEQILEAIASSDSMKDPKVVAEFIAAWERLARNVVPDDLGMGIIKRTEILRQLGLSQVPGSFSPGGERLARKEGEKDWGETPR